jgi:ATP-dependent Clp protease ATP-binding subunit ClpA
MEETLFTKRGYTKEFGARLLKREIQSFVAVPVSQFLLAKPKATTLKIDVLGDRLEIINESVMAV